MSATIQLEFRHGVTPLLRPTIRIVSTATLNLDVVCADSDGPLDLSGGVVASAARRPDGIFETVGASVSDPTAGVVTLSSPADTFGPGRYVLQVTLALGGSVLAAQMHLSVTAGIGAPPVSAPVAPTAPAWTDQPSFTDPNPTVGGTLTVDPGALTGTAPIDVQFEYLRLDGADRTSETVGLSWDNAGEAAGTVTARLRATNAAGTVLSDEITVALAASVGNAITVAPTPFSARYRVFDSGAARGENAAVIPVSGSTDAPDGAEIQARVVEVFHRFDGSEYASFADLTAATLAGDRHVGEYTNPDDMEPAISWSLRTGYLIVDGVIQFPDGDIGTHARVDFRGVKLLGSAVKGRFEDCRLHQTDFRTGRDVELADCTWGDETVPPGSDGFDGGPEIPKYFHRSVGPGKCVILNPRAVNTRSDVFNVSGSDAVLNGDLDCPCVADRDIVVWDGSPQPRGALVIGPDWGDQAIHTSKIFRNEIEGNTAGRSNWADVDGTENGLIALDPHADCIVVNEADDDLLIAGNVIRMDYNRRMTGQAGRENGLNAGCWQGDNIANPSIKIYGNRIITPGDDGNPSILVSSQDGARISDNIIEPRKPHKTFGQNAFFVARNEAPDGTPITVAGGYAPTASQASDDPSIPARAVTDIEDAIYQRASSELVTWTVVNLAVDGAFDGWVSAPRHAYSDLVMELRVSGSTEIARSLPFASGHVWAIYGQSNPHRVFDPAGVHDVLTPAPVIDPTAAQLFRAVRPGGGVERVEITDATPVSAQTVAFANAFARERPGEKLAIAAHVLPGTSPFEMINDGDPDRLWSDEAALHAEVTADGAEVGLVGSSWIAWDASETNPLKFLPVIAQAYIYGTPIALGDPVSVPTPGGSFDYTLSHALTEFYDWERTRYALFGAMGRGEDASKTGFLGGTDADYEAYVDAWRALADNSAFGFFLPYSMELQGGQRGESDGAGGWRDQSHFSADDPDGLGRLAELIALAFLQSAGLVDWTVPRFTNVAWEPSGAYADYWIAGADVTTERVRRGLPAIPDSFPHRTEVMGFSINGAAAQRAELQPDAGGSGRIGVRVYPNSGSFDFTTQIDYGRGKLAGFQQFPEDYQDKHVLNLPVADMGQTGMAAVPVQMRSAQTLGNSLPAPEIFTTDPLNPTLFRDPAQVGSDHTALRFRVEMAPEASGGDMVVATANVSNMEITIRPAGGVRLNAAGNLIATISDAVTFGQFVVIESAYDAVTGQVQMWIDGTLVIDTTTTAIGTLVSGRTIEFLSKNGGTNPAGGEIVELTAWKSDYSGSGPAHKTIAGGPATVNADPWHVGADAT